MSYGGEWARHVRDVERAHEGKVMCVDPTCPSVLPLPVAKRYTCPVHEEEYGYGQ